MDSLEYRRDDRTEEQFKKDLEKYVKEELNEAKSFLKKYYEKEGEDFAYNYEVVPWGCSSFEMYKGKSKAKKHYKPDVLILRVKKEGVKFIEEIIPCQISTSKVFLNRLHLKTGTIFMSYDEATKSVINTELRLIFIVNKGNKKFGALFFPEFLKTLKSREIVYPKCFGGYKPCYYFNTDEVEWVEL